LKRTGILGGTFDPIHNGHLAIAGEAKAYLNLNETVFLPAGQPWMKSDRTISAAEDRTAMIRLAIQSRPDCKLSTMEIEHQGASFSVDTLAAMKTQSAEPSELYFILGWDNLSKLPYWKEPRKLIELCYLVAAPRPGALRPNMKILEKEIPGISKRVILLEKPRLDISATQIRKNVAKGVPITGMVPAAVEEYIKEHGLYRN
jgi:nicotinate-nucleotide adenylyltransferase